VINALHGVGRTILPSSFVETKEEVLQMAVAGRSSGIRVSPKFSCLRYWHFGLFQAFPAG
jgi:hypothetical protein